MRLACVAKPVLLYETQTPRPEMADALTPTTVFKCLADDNRVRMMLLIAREGELCVCELTCALDESQPKVSRHLAQLRTSGLLSDRRQGQWVYYRLHPSLPDWVLQMLTVVLETNQHWLSADAKRLEDMGERPERAAACCPVR
jgi:ArsR family transcriptional regulator